MPLRRRRRQPKDRAIRVFGLNVNGLIISIASLVSWAGLTWIGNTIRVNSSYIRAIPGIQSDVAGVKQDVGEVKKEQARLRQQYVPPVKNMSWGPSPEDVDTWAPR
jgi:hypothetical protein